MRAVDYSRVSTEEQSEKGHSLGEQQEKNRNYIAMHKWMHTMSFCDPGYSAKNLKRPDMKRMITEIKAGNVDVVVVHKLDRLTRNIGDLYDLLVMFDKHNIQFVSVTENIDTSTAIGRMMVFLLGIFAQWYRENLSEEVKKGMRGRTKKGLHNVTVPMYGYDRSEEGELIVNPDEAKWVRWIFDQYISGIGTTNIARMLNDENVRRKQGARWDQKKVMTAITNLHYIGKVHWKEAGLPENERIIVKGKHEPIISIEKFNQAQAILQRRREGRISMNSYDYVFGGIVRCGSCGAGYKAKYNKRPSGLYRGYVCSHNERYGTCKQSGISEMNLTKLLFNTLTFSGGENAIKKLMMNNSTEQTNEREDIQRQLKQSELRRERWQLAFGDGNMPYEDYIKRINEEMKKVDELNNKLLSLPENDEPSMTPHQAISLLNNLKENWEHLEQTTRKQIIQSLFKQITIRKNNDKWNITDIFLA